MKRLHTLFLLCLAALFMMPAAYAQLYDVIVAKDGTGDFDNIQDAVYSIRDYKPEGRQRILVKKGVYEEKLIIPTYKTNISLIGEDRDSTILVWHDHANVVDQQGRKIGTFRSYTLLAAGPGFECENMTISNDAMTHHNPGWWQSRQNKAGVGQAVAVHIEGDRVVFRNCRLLGFQDTVFNGNGDSRQMFYKCYIEGTVDFIFGPATVWFEQCHIHAISNGYLTAASTPAEHPYGYVFNRCRITTDPSVKNEWLGRPWRNHAYTLFKECELPKTINPKGWHNWNDPIREKTTRYLEYKCYGEGASPETRVGWSKQLTDAEAALVTPENVFRYETNIWNTNVWEPSFRKTAETFIGVPYEAATLEDQKSGEVEDLIIKLDGVDCTSFVEYVAAGMIGRVCPKNPNDSILKRFVQALRYEGGKRGNYATRNHYFSQWINNNAAQGLLQEITQTLPGVKVKKMKINFMTTHASLYPKLSDSNLLKIMSQKEQMLSEENIYYLPKNRIASISDSLQEGDIIAVVAKGKGLDILHVGFVYDMNGKKHLLHASSKEKKVVVGPTIDQYIQGRKDCIGIRVVRLKY